MIDNCLKIDNVWKHIHKAGRLAVFDSNVSESNNQEKIPKLFLSNSYINEITILAPKERTHLHVYVGVMV